MLKAIVVPAQTTSTFLIKNKKSIYKLFVLNQLLNENLLK